MRLKAERITTSAEQILSLIFTEHFYLQIYEIYSSEKMFCENCFIQFVLQRPLQRCSHSVTGLARVMITFNAKLRPTFPTPERYHVARYLKILSTITFPVVKRLKMVQT